MNKMSFEIIVKEAILNQTLEVKGFEVIAEQNGSNYDVFIIEKNDPTKKYRFEKDLKGAEVLGVFEDLKEKLKQSNAMEFVKNLKFFKVEASAPAIIRSGPTIAPPKPGTKTKPGQAPVKAPRPIPMPDPKNTVKVK